MRVLAIETVDTLGSLAALDGDQILAELTLDPARRSAQTLAPAMQTLLDQVGWRPKDVQLVAVATGPGSFTGLRIGVTTAKAFAYGIGSPVQGVHTLRAIAARVPASVHQFDVVLDAQRNELFVARYLRDAQGRLDESCATTLQRADLWLQGLAPGAVVVGPGLAKHLGKIPAGVTVLDQALWAPKATAIGQLALAAYQAGERMNVFDLVPQYFRRTAAEEQWDRKHAVESTSTDA